MPKSRINRTGTALAASGLLAAGLSLAGAGAAHAEALPFASLPAFTGLASPAGIAVDAAGDVFVADAGGNKVAEMPGDATSASQQATLPFTGLSSPQGVAVDAKGDVYVADTGNNQVVELPAGSTTQVTLPFAGLSRPRGIAVDAKGDVYVADTGNYQVVELPAGASQQVTLPFTDPSPNQPSSVGVDAAGDVFALSIGNLVPPYLVVPAQILELPAGSGTEQVLSAASVGQGGHVSTMAVDAAGDVFFSGNEVASDGQDWSPFTVVAEVKAGSGTGSLIYSPTTTEAVNGMAVDPVDGDLLADFSGTGTPTDIGQYATPQAPPLAVTTASLPGGVAGSAYSQQLAASGGTAPYTWRVTAGSLPAGLALSSGGTVSGTPKKAGTATFTVQATDAGNPAQTASEQLSITVAADKANLAVTVTGPATAKAGSTVTVTLTVTDKGPAPASDVTALLATSGLTAVTPSAGGTTKTVTFFGTKLTRSSWTVATLAAGQSDTFTVTGTAPASAGKAASATGTALAATPDPDIFNNISIHTIKANG